MSRVDVDAAVVALRIGGLVVLPTDTVYGLACDPEQPEAVALLAAVKRRLPDQPIALAVASLEVLFDQLPEVPGRVRVVADELLPGPFTLVLPNPAQRFPSLAGSRADTIGVRVPDVRGIANTILETVGAVAATSSNLHGGPDPRRLEDVPAEIAEAAVLVDGGELPGTPSTVIDLTTPEPAVLREGAVPAAEALARIHRLLPQ